LLDGAIAYLIVDFTLFKDFLVDVLAFYKDLFLLDGAITACATTF